MKKKIRVIALLLSALICMPFSVIGCKSDQRKFSERVDKVIFQISWLPNDLKEESFALVKECGFDMVQLNVYQAGELDSEKCIETIEKCVKNGLKVVPNLRNAGSGGFFFGDGKLYDSKENLSKYYQNDDIIAIAMFDEPTYNQMELIADMIPRFEQNFDKDFIVNLYPEYAGAKEFNGHSYTEYVQHFSDTVLKNLSGRKWIMTDYYPYLMDMATGQAKDMEDSWLYNYELMRYSTKDIEDIHVAFYLMSCSMNGYREPTIKEMRQQLYVGLAFGAEKFGCYTYGKPIGNSYHPDGTISMVDENTGEPTRIWYAVKQMISEFRAFEDVYLQYNYNGMKAIDANESYYESKNDAFKRNPDFARLKHEIEKFEKIKSVYATQDTVLSEFFNKDGENAYIAVNYSDPAFNLSDKIMFEFKDCDSVEVIIKGVKSTLPLTNGVGTVELEPGEGCMIITK